MQHSRWLELMSRLGLANNEDTYAALVNAYSEKHRFYHSTDHISAVLRQLDESKTAPNKPYELELALWFHDAIYQPFSSTNEQDSADWAARFLRANACGSDLVNNVHKLIMATCHTASLSTDDERLIVDIDLTILGASEAVFQQFDLNVRKEYKRVPLIIYKRKRKAVLRSFLERDRIYQCDDFFERFEVQARINLEASIKNL